ncbi:hypothetical protein DPX16_23347 [Anabarilius grahami]|uniref:Uncharacterized protein n=1 Tax=Anabarilius grahami TaxID=495550 RepID=A0A3N0Y108_ANAGA|nr:hypothetical protein DPX16_23347 [Anabarilius grahami]
MPCPRPLTDITIVYALSELSAVRHFLRARAAVVTTMSDPEPSSPEPILPPTMIVSPIQWSINEQIGQDTRFEPAPPGGPEGLLYVPPAYRLPDMDSAHTSPGSG